MVVAEESFSIMQTTSSEGNTPTTSTTTLVGSPFTVTVNYAYTCN